jgi:hypothetical protein
MLPEWNSIHVIASASFDVSKLGCAEEGLRKREPNLSAGVSRLNDLLDNRFACLVGFVRILRRRFRIRGRDRLRRLRSR